MPEHRAPLTLERKMYNHNGQQLFVIDGHMHFWDANPENWRNKYGESWIKCFYAYHSSLSPAEAVWSFDKFCRYGEEPLVDDLFRTGYVDMGILNSTYLYEFYKNGFNSHVQNNVVKAKYPDRFLLCGSFDPREEEAGVDPFRRMMGEYPISGLKLYTAEWREGSRGWRLNDPWAYKYLSLAQELGVKNIHVHKGPTVYPLSADAFDVHDVDYAATDFPELFYCRACRSAASGRFLLDCCAGIECLCRAVGGDGVRSSAPEIFWRDYGQFIVLARSGQAVLWQRLCNLVTKMADREIHGIRIARGFEGGIPRRSDLRGQAQDLGRKRCSPVRDRHRGTDGQAQPGRDRPRQVIWHRRPRPTVGRVESEFLKST
jgi:hypothetical protein